MECNSCGHSPSLKKNLSGPNRSTEKSLDECPECGESLSKCDSNSNILEKNI